MHARDLGDRYVEVVPVETISTRTSLDACLYQLVRRAV